MKGYNEIEWLSEGLEVNEWVRNNTNSYMLFFLYIPKIYMKHVKQLPQSVYSLS